MKFTLTFLLLLSFWLANSQKSTASTQVTNFTIAAPQLKTNKKIWVYLPTDYAASAKKFPVIYMHEGQNLFDDLTAIRGEWNVDEILDSINAPVIIIGIANDHLDELMPFEKADSYLDFIVHTLKPKIDATYRTKPEARYTALFGSNLGGLVSFYGALKYPKMFEKIGCFSPALEVNRNEMINLMQHTATFKSRIYFLTTDERNVKEVEYWINTKRCECNKMNKKVVAKGAADNEKLWRAGFKKAYLWLF